MKTTPNGESPIFNPVSTRLSAVIWITGWKILDTVSTLIFPSWQTAEINLLVHLFSDSIGATTAVLLLTPFAAALTYLLYHRQPIFVEVLALSIPLITIGNFLQLQSTSIGSTWNLFTPFLILLCYHRTEPDLIWFDRKQPTLYRGENSIL